MRRRALRVMAVGAGVGLCAAACAPTPPPVGKDREQLADLDSRKPSKADVLLMFGAPAATFEGERILTYRMGRGYENTLTVVSPIVRSEDPRFAYLLHAEYSLVLVFDGSDTLERWSLVPVGR
jgi:hypothetical protein